MVKEPGYLQPSTSSNVFRFDAYWFQLLSEAYFHKCISISTETSILEVETIVECWLNNTY